MEPHKHRSTAYHADHDERETAWGAGLRVRYDEVAHEPLPDRFRDLLEQLEEAESRRR
jgi:hypothetical protein